MLIANSDYLNKPGGKDPWHSESKEYQQYGIGIRRSCKLLLMTLAATQRHAHFILDGIDHQRVCDKVDPTTGKRDYSIASAELRAIYRRHKSIGHLVHFYWHGHKVQAPWNNARFKKHYIAYDLARAIKLLKIISTPAKVLKYTPISIPPASTNTSTEQAHCSQQTHRLQSLQRRFGV